MRNGHNHAASGDHKAGTSNGAVSSTIRCVLVGDACVGKTALIVAYTRNGFSDRYVPTAFDNYSVTVNVDGKPLKFELCDTAGRSEFDTIRPLSYADANIFLLCFSVMKPESLKSVTERWLPELRALNSTAPVLLVGTQSDLRFGRLINEQTSAPTDSATLTHIAGQYQAEYIECSAVTQRNLKEVFDLAILYGLNQRSAPKSRNPSTTLRNSLLTSKSKTSNTDKMLKIPTKTETNKKSENGHNIFNTALNSLEASKCSPVAGVLKSSGQVSRHTNGNSINDSTKITIKGATAVDHNSIENKLPSNGYTSVHNGHKVNHNSFNSVNPYGGWLTSNENYPHHRPAYKTPSRNGSSTCSAAHSKPVIPPTTTTIKDGFRKLISMTRRFL